MKFNELTTLITSTFGNNIKPQFLQIANLELIKYINTGDRVKDGAIVIILNALLSLLLSTLNYIICKIYKYLRYNTISTGSIKNKINCKEVLNIITAEEVNKYNFKYVLGNNPNIVGYFNDVTFEMLSQYCTQHNIAEFCNTIGNVELYQPLIIVNYNDPKDFIDRIKTNNILTPDNKSSDSGLSSYFVPVEVYLNENGENEYIFLYKSNLVSKSSTELSKFISNILLYNCNFKIHNKPSTNLRILESYYSYGSDAMTTMVLGDINKNTTFDSIYFNEKEVLLEWVDKFTSETIYPKKLSLVNKLGILLYGPPGTGKTGCICALANKLKRNIHIIKSLSLKGKGQNALNRLIRERQKSDIFVFDEIDYLLNSENDDDDENTFELKKYNNMLLKATSSEEKNSILKIIEDIKKKSNESLIDIRFILSLLDGIGNDSGRVIIATTNNPDKINKLFIRPGRFDVILKLGFCSLNMFKDIVNTKFDKLDEEFYEINKNKINNILELNITPLVLINNLVMAKNIKELLDVLSILPKQTYNLSPNL